MHDRTGLPFADASFFGWPSGLLLEVRDFRCFPIRSYFRQLRRLRDFLVTFFGSFFSLAGALGSFYVCQHEGMDFVSLRQFCPAHFNSKFFLLRHLAFSPVSPFCSRSCQVWMRHACFLSAELLFFGGGFFWVFFLVLLVGGCWVLLGGWFGVCWFWVFFFFVVFFFFCVVVWCSKQCLPGPSVRGDPYEF